MRKKVGSPLGAALVIGFLLLQCVYPIRKDDSMLFRCESPELVGDCDTSGSLANFFAEAYGRDQVFLRTDLIRNVSGDFGVRYPPDVTGEMGCGERVYMRWELPEGRRAESYEELKPYFADARSDVVSEIYERWTRLEISTDQASQALRRLD